MQQYIVYAWDGTDEAAMDRRLAVRPKHFEGARRLKDNGNFIVGGAMLNEQGKMIGSMMVLQFEDEQGLIDWKNSEPYIQGAVWENISIYPFRVADV